MRQVTHLSHHSPGSPHNKVRFIMDTQITNKSTFANNFWLQSAVLVIAVVF